MKTLIILIMLSSSALADNSAIKLQLSIFQKMGECANYIRTGDGEPSTCETMKMLMHLADHDQDSMTEALKGLSHDARVEVLKDALFLQKTLGKRL